MSLHLRISQRLLLLLLFSITIFLFLEYYPSPHPTAPLSTKPPPRTPRTFTQLPPFTFPRPYNTTSLRNGLDPLLNITSPIHPFDPYQLLADSAFTSSSSNGPQTPPHQPYHLANATFLSLVRDSDLPTLLTTLQNLELRFNRHYHYPLLLLNDIPFTPAFRASVLAIFSGPVTFALIPPSDWDLPSNINLTRLQQSFDTYAEMARDYTSSSSSSNPNKEQDPYKNIPYSLSLPYRKMCHYYSSRFMHHPNLLAYKFFWRIDPHVDYFCNITYDPFRYMQDHDLIYGWTIAVYDNPHTLPTLWPTIKRFLTSEGSAVKVNPNAALGWVEDVGNFPAPGHATTNQDISSRRHSQAKLAGGYTTCHFWSNFEIASLDWFRGAEYSLLMQELERSGGWWYERWGDAPVHSLAVAALVDVQRVHWFADLGYRHVPYWSCPDDVVPAGAEEGKGEGGGEVVVGGRCDVQTCVPGRFTDGSEEIWEEDCRANWFWWGGVR